MVDKDRQNIKDRKTVQSVEECRHLLEMQHANLLMLINVVVRKFF